MSRIVVIGGHGKVARLLTPLLVRGGHSVSALFRNPAHADDVIADGATPQVFDIEHADTDAIAAQLAGHDAVVWSAGAGGGNAARTYAVDRDAAIRSMHAAAQARVRRYVMVSYLGAGLEHGIGPDDGFFAYAQAKAAADAQLRTTRWTGPCWGRGGSRRSRQAAASPAIRAAMPMAACRAPTWRRSSPRHWPCRPPSARRWASSTGRRRSSRPCRSWNERQAYRDACVRRTVHWPNEFLKPASA